MILITALYKKGLTYTSLQLRGQADSSVLLSISHDNKTTVSAVEIAGNATSDHYIVHPGDTFTIVARSEGHIVAAGLFEVDRTAMQFGILLSPCCATNLVVDQAEGTHTDSAFEYALSLACADTEAVKVVKL